MERDRIIFHLINLTEDDLIEKIETLNREERRYKIDTGLYDESAALKYFIKEKPCHILKKKFASGRSR